MKTPSRNYKTVLIAASLLIAGFCLAASESDQSARIVPRITYEINDYSWMHHGRLVNFLVSANDEGYFFSIYLKEGKQTTLTSSLEGMSYVVQQEINANELHAFIKDKLSEFLECSLPFGGVRLLNKDYLASYERDVANPIPAPYRGDKASLAILRGICTEPEVTFEKDSWQIIMKVIYRVDGHIERWTVHGALDKFTIQSWNREVLVEAGKVRSLAATGPLY